MIALSELYQNHKKFLNFTLPIKRYEGIKIYTFYSFYWFLVIKRNSIISAILNPILTRIQTNDSAQ